MASNIKPFLSYSLLRVERGPRLPSVQTQIRGDLPPTTHRPNHREATEIPHRGRTRSRAEPVATAPQHTTSPLGVGQSQGPSYTHHIRREPTELGEARSHRTLSDHPRARLVVPTHSRNILQFFGYLATQILPPTSERGLPVVYCTASRYDRDHIRSQNWLAVSRPGRQSDLQRYIREAFP